MRDDVKQAWVEALESDEFKQGESALKQGDRFCCLGVLCEVARTKFGLDIKVVPQIVDYNGYEEYDEWASGDGDTFVWNGEGDWEVLPESVAAWAGIETNPEVDNPEDGSKIRLSDLNDNGSTFHEIAKLIKESDL